MNLICNRGLGTGGFSFYNVLTDASGGVDQSTTNEIVNIDGAGAITTFATIDSTSVGTGALIVKGGVGIAKNAQIGGITTITDATDSTAIGNGALIVAGGLSIAKNSNIAGIEHISNNTNSTASTNRALVVSGGVGVAKDLYVSGNIHCTGTVSSADTNLYQEFHSVIVGGASGTITGTITLNVPQGNTNYAVFSSIYDNLGGTYNLGGSGGTYNSGDTSNAMQAVIIEKILQVKHFNIWLLNVQVII
jgi:enhancing lycopene biosynthesis protein 2